MIHLLGLCKKTNPHRAAWESRRPACMNHSHRHSPKRFSAGVTPAPVPRISRKMECVLDGRGIGKFIVVLETRDSSLPRQTGQSRNKLFRKSLSKCTE